MTRKDYAGLSVSGFLKGVQNGDVDLADFYPKLFARLRELQQSGNYFVTLAEQEAFAAFPEVRPGRLSGLPVSVKDNICTEGIQSTAGSRILEGYRPPFDATSVARAKHEGGIVIGKTQQDEFGFGTFSVNSGFGVPKHPLDPARSCGGSSGGAAGLTRALDLPHVAIAESTGGSISAPASFCGVVGLTPTYGLVSRWGLIDYANSLDKIGVIAKTVDDAALVLSVIEGFDTKDFTSIKRVGQKTVAVEKMRIGVPKEYFAGVDKKIADQVWRGIDDLESRGATVTEVSLPSTTYALPAYYIIATAEASTNLARYCGMRYGPSPAITGNLNEFFSRARTAGFGAEAKRRIMLGTFARMAGYRGKYYLKAFQARRLVMNDFERAFQNVDVLAAPTMPLVAPKFTEIEKLAPIDHYRMDILTVGPNLAGIPHLTVPCGEVRGLPVGLHLLGDHLQEGKLIAAAKVIEAREAGT